MIGWRKNMRPNLDEIPRRKGGTEADSGPSARKKVHGEEPAAHETEEQHAQRMRRAWDAIGNCSSRVQRFETSSGKRLLKVRELMDKGQTHEASLELMALGGEVDDVSKSIREAKALAKGNEKYEKEIAFYEEWHHKARAKIHGAIADTKDLGKHVAVSGFGISEKTHADIFENTRAIFAVQGKVIAFAGAVSDRDAKPQVEKVLAEAKAAKAQLNALKAKYKGDKAAYQFLTAHGEQDRLIDQSIAKLEQGLHGGAGEKKDKRAEPGRKESGGKKLDLGKAAEHGLSKLDDFRKKAVKAGWKVDAGLGKVEKMLKRGVSVGKKVDRGLEHLFECLGPETCERFLPAPERSRHRDGENAS